ncbi:MAG: hypothetical protein KBA46_04660 [Candidatus Omnitrophica bacterium]|nr:hypothetical protein [Candidatus Omnitrophota bacterium]
MLNLKGRNFVTLMIVISLVSLGLRFGVKYLIASSITQNESDAQAVLKLISVAFENYARDHLGVFPSKFSSLVENQPAYLDKDYLVDPPKGYEFVCSRLEESGFSCSAVPQFCNFSGKKIFTITNGGLTWEECGKKEADI